MGPRGVNREREGLQDRYLAFAHVGSLKMTGQADDRAVRP